MGTRLKRIKNRIFDIGTSNTSFLQLANDLKTLGVKNWYFLLEVKDPSVVGINPYKVDKDGNCALTKEEISRVVTECRRNPWYYLREVSRIPAPGRPEGSMYKANRGNIAQAWLFFHHIDSWLCLPRQQGKTQSAIANWCWAYSFGTTNSTFISVNKQVPDAKENLARMKDQLSLLPEYLRFEYILDDDTGKMVKAMDNATGIKHPVTKNKVTIKAGSATPAKAMSTARGLTSPAIHYDEPEFTENIDIIVDNSISTYETAARLSKENGGVAGRMFTSTPGDLDTKAGISAQKLIDNCVRWTEKMYDMSDEEMENYATASNSNHIVYIEFQYYQIGLDNAWLENVYNMTTDKLTFRREILLQRIHGSSLSPYDQEDIEYINERMKLPIKEIFIKDYFRFDVYEEIDANIPYVVGVDCSTGTNKDFNAITAINPYTLRPVMEFECNFVGETLYEQIIIELVLNYIPRAIVCIERNSIGDGIIDHLMNSRIAPRLYYDKSGDLLGEKFKEYDTQTSMLTKHATRKSFTGVYTEGKSRERMFAILADRIKDHKEDFVTRNIIRDISRLVRSTSGKIVAGDGFHDDSIMSYLIGMYVLIHGDNLPMFGYIPGEKEPEEKNKGLFKEYSREQLQELLPSDVADSIIEDRKISAQLNYENILRNAILESQKDTYKLMNSSLNVSSGNLSKEEIVTFDDESNDYDLSFFDEINHLGMDDGNNGGLFF